MWLRYLLGAWAQDFLRPKRSHKSLVRMLISEVSVRCTGHLLAISSNRECCSALKGPSNRTSRSILSSMPSLVSHSEQSAAYIFECRSQTVTRSSGQFFSRAYIPTVIEVQEPRAASKSRKGMARYQCLQRYPAHRFLADVGLPQSAVRTCPLHPKRSRPPMSFLQEQRSYSPLSLHMMSTRFSTARTQGLVRARYPHTPYESSKLSRDLDVIVKPLTSNSCE